MSELEKKYKTLFGAYFGITLMDEYPLKEYMLEDIKKYIDAYIQNYPLDNFNYQEFKYAVDKEESDIVKLQDALRIGNELNFPTELIHMIKEKIRIIRDEERWFVKQTILF